VPEESNKDKKKKDSPKFCGNYQGPLYAPHPDLINERKTNRSDTRTR
jgi:hypothetical protein